MQEEVDIYTDGACSGNPGPGGWGAILRSGAHEKEIWGGEPATTNNRMELLAVIRALNTLKRPVSVRMSSRVAAWTPCARLVLRLSPEPSALTLLALGG